MDFVFFLNEIDQLDGSDRHFQLTVDEIRLLNPNTNNCPTFRNKKDAELVKKIYRQVPVFVNEITNSNPWSATTWRMFNETDDYPLFKTEKELWNLAF